MVTKKKPQEAMPADCMPKCASCAFFDIEPKDDVGICRRYPPKVVVVNDEIEMVVPATLPSDWCGEFSRRTS